MAAPWKLNAVALFRLALNLYIAGEPVSAELCATEAIRIDPWLTEAYLFRGDVRRAQHKWVDALDDYTVATDLDPQNAGAWLERGSMSMKLATKTSDRISKLELMKSQAYPSYRRAGELDPGNVSVGLSLLELEICLSNWREAVSTAGALWGLICLGRHKIVCAWLGSIALILAGKPKRKWSPYADFLHSRHVSACPVGWDPEEITEFLRTLESENGCDAGRICEIKLIHNLFLEHFSDKPGA